MRLWLKDSERRPDPAPVTTDDRKAMLVGLVLWAVALIVLLFLRETLVQSGNGWWLWTCVIGLALGLVGILYAHAKRA